MQDHSAKPFPVPVVALGPGSQPGSDPFDFLPLPHDMPVFAAPGMGAVEDPAIRARVIELLEGLVAEARASRPTAAVRVTLGNESPAVLRALNDVLGQGEVSILANHPVPLRIQETAFAGLWRVVGLNADTLAADDRLELCAMPDAALAAARAVPEAPVARSTPSGLMNAPALLHEVIEVARSRTPGAPAHVVNLTLLPMSDADLAHLVEGLGAGTTAILSRGYGNCRISSTAIADVWWVQYYNSTDQLILDTIEVVDIPEVACAAREDIEDTLTRLLDHLDELRSAQGDGVAT